MHDAVLRRGGDHVGDIAPRTIEEAGRDIVFLADRADLVTVLAAANPGFSFVNWTEDGLEITNSPSFSFVASSNRTLVANFAAVPPEPCLDNNEPNDSSLTATATLAPT